MTVLLSISLSFKEEIESSELYPETQVFILAFGKSDLCVQGVREVGVKLDFLDDSMCSQNSS